MMLHYLIYNERAIGPYLSLDAMFTDLALLVMHEKPTVPATWFMVETDDEQPGDGEEGEACKPS